VARVPTLLSETRVAVGDLVGNLRGCFAV